MLPPGPNTITYNAKHTKLIISDAMPQAFSIDECTVPIIIIF